MELNEAKANVHLEMRPDPFSQCLQQLKKLMLLCFHTAKSMGTNAQRKSYININDLESYMTPAKLLIVSLIFFFLSKLSYISSV